MFSQSTKKRDRSAPGDGEASQPLLNGSQEDLAVVRDSEDPSQVLFSAQDDEDLESNSGHSDSHRPRGEHTVRFQQEVQVISPSLRSTMQSREAGAYSYQDDSTRLRTSFTEYELDSDDFDDTTLAEIGRQQSHVRPSRSGRRRERPIPLLAGLLDSSASRRTPETTIPMYDSEIQGSFTDLDLGEVTAKQHAGGGMLDSIANMANSILGAGEHSSMHVIVG
jgi:sodium-coupled neutral amino acid transporter 11